MRNHNSSCSPGRGERWAIFELSSTLKIPNALGLTIPPSLPLQVDKVMR
jgi:hypothetical protein